MGTAVELCIDKVSLSYSKNHMGEDFGYLFQETDFCSRQSDAIDSDYYKEHPEEAEEIGVADELFARTLSRTIPRLNILGYTIEAARAEYQALITYEEELNSELEDSKVDYLSFDEFCDLVCKHPLSELKDGCFFADTPDEKALVQGRFAVDIDLFERLPLTDNSNSYWSEASFLSARIDIMSAKSMLQVFALNSANAELEVLWGFGPIVYAGWVEREAFQASARQKQKVLIATEGASDARIIRRSLDVLRPDVADFFNFVDVDERHHFWGTGNLVKFAEGLLRIEVLNQVLFVFDNDAEGVVAYRKLEDLKLPKNMRTMLLPDIDEFSEFSTFGPEGVNKSDINGRAAAIECYLDLHLDNYPPAQVKWSNYKKDIDAWHGALDYKETYAKKFYQQSNEDLLEGNYDVSKLLKLIDVLIVEAGLVTPLI